MNRWWLELLPINRWDALQLGGMDVKETVKEKDDDEEEGDAVEAGE